MSTCSLVYGYQHLKGTIDQHLNVDIYYSEDRDSMLFQYNGTLLPHYEVSYPRRLQYQSDELQKHQISN